MPGSLHPGRAWLMFRAGHGWAYHGHPMIPTPEQSQRERADLQWRVTRLKPYTVLGIRRVRCIRCGDPAVHQWTICADHHRFRPLCNACDVALNRLVLEWAGCPDTDSLISDYTRLVDLLSVGASHRS